MLRARWVGLAVMISESLLAMGLLATAIFTIEHGEGVRQSERIVPVVVLAALAVSAISTGLRQGIRWRTPAAVASAIVGISAAAWIILDHEPALSGGPNPDVLVVYGLSIVLLLASAMLSRMPAWTEIRF